MITTEKMNIENAMSTLGVTDESLSNIEKETLDKQDFLVINHVIDPAWYGELSNVFESAFKTEGYLEGRKENAVSFGMADYIKKQFNVKDEDYTGDGLRQVTNLVNEGPVFDRVYTHPKALAAAYHLLKKEFKLSALNGCEAISGEGNETIKEGNSVQVLWALDDFIEDCTVQITSPHNKELNLSVPAASICILGPNTKASITRNVSNENKRFLNCSFILEGEAQELDQSEYLRVSTYERIIPAARFILGV